MNGMIPLRMHKFPRDVTILETLKLNERNGEVDANGPRACRIAML
jgi:hypothetical protein